MIKCQRLGDVVEGSLADRVARGIDGSVRVDVQSRVGESLRY